MVKIAENSNHNIDPWTTPTMMAEMGKREVSLNGSSDVFKMTADDDLHDCYDF
jgi:hypothetical protein